MIELATNEGLRGRVLSERVVPPPHQLGGSVECCNLSSGFRWKLADKQFCGNFGLRKPAW